MTRYLVVAHQTATSPALLQRATTLAASDRAATFTLLVPATHPTNLLEWDPQARFVWDEEATFERARQQASLASAAFLRAGLRVTGAIVGDHSPLLAVEDELRAHPGVYDAIVLSTLPASRSRWIAADVGSHLERLGLPLIHVEGKPAVPSMAERATAGVRRVAERVPLPARARAAAQVFAMPEGGRGIAMIAAVMALYLIGSAFLGITLDRRFFLNDVMALAIFGAMLGWQVVEARRTHRPGPPR